MRAVADVRRAGGGIGAQGEESRFIVRAAFVAAGAGVASFGIWHIEFAFSLSGTGFKTKTLSL